MQLAVTERFFRDFQGLPGSLANKCRELMGEVRRIEPAALRLKALPGWRLHHLRGSNMVSLSIDMNFRVLAELDGGTLILHRVIKHDSADRADVNRNDRGEAIGQMAPGELLPAGVYDALRSFGVPDVEAAPFRGCVTEDDLLSAAVDVPATTAIETGVKRHGDQASPKSSSTVRTECLPALLAGSKRPGLRRAPQFPSS